MKKLLAFALITALTACSHAEPPPSEANALPLPDAAPASAASAESSGSDSLLANAENATPTTSATATESKAADSLLATPVDNSAATPTTSAKTESLSQPTPPPAPELPAAPTPPEPKVAENHEVPPPSPMPSAKADPRKRDVYQEYKEYKEKAASRQDLQDAYEERSMFPHEDGGWQVGIDYVRKAFPGMDFDPTLGVNKADTMGGVLSLNYFPLRSLSYGRLGVGVNYAVYWTKYSIPTTGTTIDSNKVHSIDSFGSKFIYEADYWLGQLIVPFGFYGFDKVTVRPYSLISGGVTYANYPKNTFNRQSYGGGAHINLNRLEPSSASRGLAAMGIRKTYVTYTFLQESGGGTGASHLLGLRFEF